MIYMRLFRILKTTKWTIQQSPGADERKIGIGQ
jgi:hypothetical protein